MTPGDLRFALRQIARTPLLSFVVITVIALGIGINVGLLTVLHVYGWRPAPGIAPDAALVRLMTVPREGGRGSSVALSFPGVREMRARGQVFQELAAWRATTLPVDLGGGAEPVLTFYTTANYFNLLRVALVAGSGFPAGADETPEPIAVIGHSVWMNRFEGAADVIGRTIRIRDTPFTVVGVAPPRFGGVDLSHLGRPAVWIPLGARALLDPGAAAERSRPDATLEGFARLASGLRPGDVRRATGTLDAERMTAMSRSDGSTREFKVALAIVLALIVLITCTNVSALLLGRAVARRREVAVRLALGASRLRIVRQMLTESLVYAVGGAALGLGLYTTAIQIGYATIPGAMAPGLEARPATFVAAAALALLTTIVFGLAPALHASRAGIGEVIKNSGPQAIRRSRLQSAFVVVQLASSQPVLVVTALVLLDLRGPGAAERAPASVVTLETVLFRAASPESTDVAVRATPELIRRRVELISGVESAAIEARGGGEWLESGTSAAELRQIPVTGGYLTSRGIPLVRGRAIEPGDDYPGSGTVVVSEAAALRLWPGEDPIGKRLTRRPRDPGAEAPALLEVIGLAGPEPWDPGPAIPAVFVPLSHARSLLEVVIVVRTAGDARPFIPRIRAAIGEIDPHAAVGRTGTLAERSAEERRQAVQANGAAFAVGAAALVLASLGLYAIIAFAVNQRTREIGVRLAIGASPGGVVRQFLRSGLRVSALGLVIGLPITVAGVRVVQAGMVGFAPRMAVALPAVVGVLLAVAALASWLPARRAGRVDPVVALRSE